MDKDCTEEYLESELQLQKLHATKWINNSAHAP